MRQPGPRRYSLAAIFLWPLVLAVLSIVGLVAALTGDGWRDWVSWAALGAPVAVLGWAFLFKRR